MSLKGSFSGKTANSYIKPTITWSAVQSVEGNYSDITATLTYRRSNSYTTYGHWEGSLTIGEQTFSGRKYIEITNREDTVAITATARICHDAYGALTVTIRAEGGIDGTTLTDTDISGTVTPDPIPRASTVSAAPGEIGSRATVVVGRKNDSFTHSVAYCFGELSGYLDADGNPVDAEVLLTATTVNFLLPESFYTQIPDAPSGLCTLTCRTYSGGSQIGRPQTGVFTVTAGFENCKPQLSAAVVDANPATVAVTGDENVLVQFLSTARCTMEVQGQKGASIVSMGIAGVGVTEPVLELPEFSLQEVVFTATDSRGYSVSRAVRSTVLPYVPLTDNASVRRTDPTSGNAVLTLQGSCWNGDFGAVSNSLTATVQVGEQTLTVEVPVTEDHRYALELPLSGLDYTRSHRVQVELRDALMTAGRSLPVQKGIPVFDWSETDFRFHVPVEAAALTVNGTPLETYIKNLISQSQE